MFRQYYPELTVALKLLMAMLCGGAIGLERELSRKAAGLRTNVLICMGAVLYMIVSRHIGGGAPYTDPARLAAQVVTGIGFLGAGVILQSRGSVTGLTTAATIFVVGAVGIAIGEGLFGIAAFSTTLIIVVLVVLRSVERAVIKRRRMFHYTMTSRDPSELLERLLDLFEKEHVHLEDFEVREIGVGQHEVKVSVVTSLDGNRRLLRQLRTLGGELLTSTQHRLG
ncbi:MAG TPA: MgtC/SapB family protein [Pyrinomonadaceae bacterium]|nr:MgtC/SapB family protein [Pyrinomonadaceae bacterium]